MPSAVLTAPSVDETLFSADGTDQTQRFITAAGNADTAGHVLKIDGVVNIGGAVINGSVRIRGTADAKITFNSAALGLDIRGAANPPSTVLSNVVNAVATGQNVVTMTNNPGMVPHAHIGKYVEITDGVVNPLSGNGTVHVREIMDNDATSFTVKHPFGYPIPVTATLLVITPIPKVDIRDVDFDRTVAGSANIVIRYALSVVIKNVKNANSGNYAGGSGNALAVYHARKVRVSESELNHAGGFAGFFYNCENAIVSMDVNDWGGSFALQMKDCRNSKFRDCNVFGNGVVGDNCYSIKCSGLNLSSNVYGINCYGEAGQQANFEISSITAEGTYFSARNVGYDGCVSVGSIGGAGFSTVYDGGADAKGIRHRHCASDLNNQHGYACNTPNVVYFNCDARGNGFEAFTTNANVDSSARAYRADNVVYEGGVWEDNCTRYGGGGAAARSSQAFVTTSNVNIRKVKIVENPLGAAAPKVIRANGLLRAIRDTGGDHLVLEDVTITDLVGTYLQDYQLTGAGSIARGEAVLDSFAVVPGTIAKVAYQLGGNTVLSTSSTTNLNSIGNAINTAGKYTGKAVWNVSTSKPVFANGPLAADTWKDATGAVVNTPV
jgi:hypothetical protein